MIKLDENQLDLKREFDLILNRIPDYNSLLSKIFSNKKINFSNFSGLYIYSKPGRGKTMLMKEFYQSANIKKSYFHFNDFMYQIHSAKHNLRTGKESQDFSNKDLIKAVNRVIKGSRLICFDEFQVSDIADAMILGRIFTYFIENDIFVIATSNCPPDELYKDGIQRELFLDFVNSQLLEKYKIIHFKSEKDYRMLKKKGVKQRFFVKDGKINEFEHFNDLKTSILNHKMPQKKSVTIWGRDIKIHNSYENIAVFEYKQLIDCDYSATDYRAICQEFDLIFLENLPKFNIEMKNEMKRFMFFIDEVYENNCGLIILSCNQIEQIYNNGVVKENARVISRLNEIKSDSYFNNSKYSVK